MRPVRLGLLAIAIIARSPHAQTSDSLLRGAAHPVFSMGQPSRWLPYASAFGTAREASPAGIGALIGVTHPILNPVTGLFSVSAEVLDEWQARRNGVGAHLIANAPAFGLGVGIDWTSTSGANSLVTFQTAVRRGGLVGLGSMLRIDWRPALHGVRAGIQVPVGQPFAGRTRPRHTDVDATGVPTRDAVAADAKPLPDSAERALRTVSDAASLIRVYSNLYSANDEATLDAGARSSYGRSFDSVERAYTAALAAAFGLAAGDSRHGNRIAARAQRVVLDDLVLPYDALFGRLKGDRVTDGMRATARTHFTRWLSDSGDVSPAAHGRVLVVYERWLDIIERVRHELSTQWKDSRLLWLPPQLALRADLYDEQSEVDSLVGRVVGHAFTDSNSVAYLRTADLTLEIARSIIAARRYHVLWTHDFTGRRPSGRLDEISYTIVADAYLPALTAAVQQYDSTGSMPEFMLLLDAFYYHERDGQLWMDVLENPLHAPIHLRADEVRQADHLRERLAALRIAVAGSRRLQREAAAHGGDAWLAQVVRVHVSVVLPSDFSFRSIGIIPPIPFTPDNISRDHRKMVLADFTETDPYDGELLVTGIGIGEHYASATWEDRGYRVRGPAVLEARAELRRALAANGFRPDQIPVPLRATDGPSTSPTRLDGGRDVARVLHVHNEVGFGAKESSVARAMLYSLAPPGSVIVVPDPLWVSATWAAMLAGAAARGCTVVIIAPALPNAPSPEKPIIALEHDLLDRLVSLQDFLAKRNPETGGPLHIGIYAAHAPVSDVAGRSAEVRAGLERAPWIRELIPFDANALSVLNRATAQADQSGAAATALARDEAPREPQMHQKTQLIARPGAIAALVRQPGWEHALAGTLRAQSLETAKLADAIGSRLPASDTGAVRASDALLQGYEASLSESERRQLSFYFLVGTQNEDPRGLMIDGEASVIVSGFGASAGVVDLFYLMARTTWIDSNADVDRFVPRPRGLIARFANIVRFVM